MFAGYGVYGISTDRLVIPYMRHDADYELRQLHNLHFQGALAWLVFAAMMLVVAGCGLMILAHVQTDSGQRLKANLPGAVLGAGFLIILAMAELRVWGAI